MISQSLETILDHISLFTVLKNMVLKCFKVILIRLFIFFALSILSRLFEFVKELLERFLSVRSSERLKPRKTIKSEKLDSLKRFWMEYRKL